MRTIILAILGLSIAIVSCAGPKGRVVAKQCEEIAKGPDKEEQTLPLKRHNKW